MFTIFLMCLYMYIPQLLVIKWMMYKEIVKPSAPHISLFKSCYVLWLPVWWALWLPWLITSRMQQCFNVLIDIYYEFLLLFYCCVLLEIKLTTTTTKVCSWPSDPEKFEQWWLWQNGLSIISIDSLILKMPDIVWSFSNLSSQNKHH